VEGCTTGRSHGKGATDMFDILILLEAMPGGLKSQPKALCRKEQGTERVSRGFWGEGRH